ncbi:GEVED domain-containing protein [Adhaeribacter terreus]|uniref:GEVED domain-containing protein n=1 Tax=Adhaeribacter terreus TaxID=529703 RepID=A0ABW0EE06_9BACT
MNSHYPNNPLKRRGLWLFALLLFIPGIIQAQVTVNASGGSSGTAYTNLNSAFTAINSGTHTGIITIAISGNTTEPTTPVPLNASGQGTTNYSSITIKPTATATISGNMALGRGVIELLGSDFVTIDGSITSGGTSRDLTIQNTNNAVTYSAVIRLIGASSTFAGATNNTIKNCKIIGASATVAGAYGIHAGSSAVTAISSTSGSGYNFDQFTVENNEISTAGVGILVRNILASATSDKLFIHKNDIHNILTTGIQLSKTVGGAEAALISENTIYDFKATTAANTTDIQGIWVEADVIDATFSRNKIYGIYNYGSGGEGAFGIHINGSNSNNLNIQNNLIYDLRTVSANSGSTQVSDGAFGIRIDGSNTGHNIYYNSIHLFGAPLDNTAGGINTAALHVNSSSNTNLDIRNNIFSNQMSKGSANAAVFAAVSFSASYNYSTLTMNNNGYFVGATADHCVGRQTTSATYYQTVADWKTVTQASTASPTNDNASVPLVNSAAPFTSDLDLTIPANTVTALESGATTLPVTTDFTGNSRPRTFVPQASGANSNPDIGAYEFNGGLGDFAVPAISAITKVIPSCTSQSHTISATITDASGVATVIIEWSLNGVTQAAIAMTKQGATDEWLGTIPAQSSNLVEYNIKATDNSSSSNVATSGSQLYRDNYLTLNAGPDINSTINSGAVLTAESFNYGGHIKITEVLQYKGTAGAEVVYAGFIPTTDNEFVEISNTGNLTVDVSGYIMQMVGTISSTFVVPNGTVLEPGQVLTLATVGSANDPANRFFGMNAAASTQTSSVPWGYVLKNNSGKVIDVLGTNSVSFSALQAIGVSAADWSTSSGTFLFVASSRVGVQRQKDANNRAMDTNTENDWVVSTTAGPQINLGIYNNYVPTETTAITWTNGTNGNLTSPLTGKSVTTPNFAAGGTYNFIATINDGTCSYQDEVTVTVTAPVLPVAEFTATPTTVTTTQIVAFTDQSTNIPGSWNWTFIGPGTVTYQNGTSATSQNPEVKFNAAGVYTVTLDATNGAGTSTKTRTDYITVYWGYCEPLQSNCGSNYINSVVLNTLVNNNSNCSNTSALGAYSNYLPTAYTTSLMIGNNYSLNVTPISSSTSNVAAWIDFNNNGVFETTEFLGVKTSVTSNTQTSFAIAVPLTATTGKVGLRIRQMGTSIAAADACKTFTSLAGETEDYVITIQARASVDAGIGNLIAPLNNTCANTNQPVVVRLYNKGTAAITNIPVAVNITGAASTTISGTYSGTIQVGDSIDFTVGNLITSTGGIFNFSASTNIAGDGDASNDDMPTISRNINVQPSAPATTDASFCTGSAAILTASGTGTLRWYDQATGGTLLASGTSFTTPVLSATTSYYVEAAGNPTDKAGLTATTTASGSYATSTAGYGLNFTANQDIILKGVHVYVRTAGSPVIIQLRDNAGTVLKTAATVTVANLGVKTYIPLDFAIPAGTYRLTSGNTTTIAQDYSTTNTAVKYPFNSSNNEVTITSGRSSTNTTTAYYGFYDWDILVNGCPSTRTLVTATMGEGGQWTGTTSNDWNVGSNWCSGTVPTATTDVTLPAGLTTYPQITSGTAQVKNFTIASGATFTMNGGTLQLSGDLTNSGTYTQTTGLLELTGTGSQQINGIALANLTINGGGTKTLGGNVTVNGAVTMTSGILNTGTFKLILGATATISETNTSYVIGEVETVRNLNTASTVTFGGMGIELTPASGSVMPGNTTVRRVTGTQMNGGGPGYSIPRYFDIQSAVNSGLNVNMLFRYLDHEVAAYNEATLALFRSPDQGTTWNAQTASVADPASNTVTLAGVSGFSLWTAGDINNPLPVELVAFNAIKKGNDAFLTWTTASEYNSKGFDIEVSTNSHDFRKIGFAESRNGNTLQQYTFTDIEKGKNGTRYYRLKQTDFDGAVSYSPIKAVAFNTVATQVNVYPNPFSADLNVTVESAIAAEIPVVITDLTGKTVWEKAVKVEKGANLLKLDPANNLPSGVYLLQMQIGSERFTTKLIKQ